MQPLATPHPQTRTRTRAAGAVLALAAVLALTLLAPASALAITRDQVLARAQVRVDAPVHYSQSRYYGGYRTDCSGYVSYCWATGTSYCTATFPGVTHKIAASQLAPGDALLKPGYHIRLFYGWVDDAHTTYVAYEAGDNLVAICRLHSIADDLHSGFYPARYNHIANSPRPLNVLRNSAFSVWARQWGGQPDTPVWWQTNAGWWQTLAYRRRDVSHSQGNSLKLVNPDTDPSQTSDLSQQAPVSPGTNYRLTAYALTPSDSNGIKLHLAYLDAFGQTLAETSTSGGAWGLSATGFRAMTLVALAPTGTVSAEVSVRLAGGTTGSGTTTSVAGTSVTLDDITLAPAQLAVGISASAMRRHSRQSFVLTGTVSPSNSVGAAATVYMLQPGSTAWKAIASAPVKATVTGTGWAARYRLMTAPLAGTYRFKASVPATAGYLGNSSKVVSVVLR